MKTSDYESKWAVQHVKIMASFMRHDIGDIFDSPKVIQRGFGLDSDFVMHGFGVGTILKSYFFQALPYLKNFSKSIGREFLRSANELVSTNNNSQPNLAELVKNQGKKSLKNIGREYLDKIDGVQGEGKRRKKRKKIIKKNLKAFDFENLNMHIVKNKKKPSAKGGKKIIKSKISKVDTLF